MAMRLRRFTDEGLERANDLLDEIDAGGDSDVSGILTDDGLTEVLSQDEIVDMVPFETRFDAGRYLYELLYPLEDELGDVQRDKHLWTWLSLAWIDKLAPRDEDGVRHLGDRILWVPAVDDYRKYYRHYLAGPYRIFRAHADEPHRALGVLCTPPNRPGDVAEQIVSKQGVVTNPALMQVVTHLYYDDETETFKRGAAGRKGGSARRFRTVFDQLDLTWDLYGMEPEEILEVLPSEFDRFREEVPEGGGGAG